MPNRPQLSVVIVSYNSPKTLQLCLQSLAEQQPDEVVVADCSDEDPTEAVRKRFPGIEVLHFGRRMSIPQLRWQGYRHTSGDIVANLESWMVPGPQWVEALREAHQKNIAPVVGGPVAFEPGVEASAFRWADFFYEYGRHMAPITDGPADELTGANCSYKRSALEGCQDLLAGAAWDTAIHERLRGQGGQLWRAGCAVAEYQGSPALAQAVRQRFHYGRWYAGDRRKRITLAERLFRAAIFPAAPVVLLFRLWRSLGRKPRGRAQLLRSLPWLSFFYGLWALGEVCSYLFGSGSSEHRIF